MGKKMIALYRRLTESHPEVRQVIIGAGLAIDPLPEKRYETFERSDSIAMSKDWAAVAGDMRWAVGRAKQERDERRA